MMTPSSASDEARVRCLEASEAEARLDELSALLVDAVAHGASVNFLAGFSDDEGRVFWRGQLPGVATRERRLLVVEVGDRLVGTVVLTFAHQPNAPHRAEISKMLIHSSARRRGLGRRLLAAAETAAGDAGRTLLILDTETGSAGDALYRSCGYIEVGRIPAHSLTPAGVLAETTVFYKALGPHRAHPSSSLR
jgi:GNAT superfamily N-acetyltransferase